MSVAPENVVRSTCPYCGVGCQMDMHIRDGLIYRVEAPFDSAPNYGNLLAPPTLGRHTAEVLREWLGLDESSAAVPNTCGNVPDS